MPRNIRSPILNARAIVLRTDLTDYCRSCLPPLVTIFNRVSTLCTRSAGSGE
jgi:hypothetical protein